MLTVSPDLRRYLTGFASSFGFVYTDAQESVFFTDPRYAEGARAALKNTFIAVEVAKSEETVLDYIKSKKIKTLAVPTERLTLVQYGMLKKRKFKLFDCMPALNAAMSVKTEEEIACIARGNGVSYAFGRAERGHDRKRNGRAARVPHAQVRRGGPLL